MNRAELAELIHNGESSGVEFKRDDIHPEKLAKEMAALLNLEGGHILLGVENDRTVSGLTRDPAKAEEWVMEVARGSSFADLDRRRLVNYFRDLLRKAHLSEVSVTVWPKVLKEMCRKKNIFVVE